MKLPSNAKATNVSHASTTIIVTTIARQSVSSMCGLIGRWLQSMMKAFTCKTEMWLALGKQTSSTSKDTAEV